MRTALREKYDPDQPRDEDGKWTSGGGGGGDGAAPPAAAPATPPPQSSPRPTPGKISGKEIKGMPEGATIHSRSLSEAMDRGAFEFTAKPAPTGRFETNDRFDLTIAPKLPSGVESYQVWRDEPERVGYYNPKLADLVTEDFGNGLARTSVKAKADVQTDIQSLDDPDTIYRGISFEEWESIQTTGEIKSRGEYNIGEAQQGLTYYTEQADTAAYYASGFAPWQYKATFEKPAFVVAVKRPHEERVVPGTAEHEVGVARPVRADEIVAAWRGDPYAMHPGWMQLRRSGYEGEDFVEGGGSSPSSSVAWSRVDPPRQRRSAVVRAQRMAVARARAERLLNVGLKFNQPRDGSCEPAARPIFEVRYDPDQPRDEGGKWTSGGGDGGAGEAQPASTGVAAERAGQPSVAFSRRSPTDAERLRGTVAVHQPTAESAQALRDAGITPVTYHEAGAAGAGRFHDAIVSAKTGKYAAAVTAYPTEDYAGMRTFLSEDGKAGFALKGDDIVSAFKHPDSDASGFATTALALATQQGGDRLDAFDTVLPELYSQNGFRAVARIPWNDEYAPEGWSKETFRAFNGGSPDVVFMVHDPAGASSYRAGDGARVADYDAGIAAQRAALTQLRQAIAASWRNSVRKWIAIEIGRTPEQVIRTQRMRVARARAEALLEKFDPNQPRDEDGKWTSGGGGGGGDGASSGGKPAPRRSETTILQLLEPSFETGPHPVEVMINPNHRDLISLAKDSPIAGGDDAYDIGGVSGEYFAHAQGALRVVHDTTGNLFAWNAERALHDDVVNEIGNLSGMDDIWEHIDDDGDLWYLVGGRLHSDIGYQNAYARQSDRGEETDTDAAREARMRAARRQVNEWIAQGTAAARTAKKWPKWLRDMLAKAFDPNQPRDEQGRWTDGGGGDGGGAATPASSQRPAGAKHPGAGYSKDSWEDASGVIHTGDVYDAQRALHDGRKVSLDQPRTLSTLLDKLGATAKDMAAKGENAPAVDLCNVTVKGTSLFCADTQGIPRIQMPQLPGDKIDAFADYLKQQGYTSERTTELASYLKATQNQLDGTKVAGMMGAMEKTPDAAWITSPLVVSRDDYIVDGHHRWAAKVGMDARNNNLEQGMRMNVVRVDIGIIDLLQHAHTFTGGKGRVGFGERALQTMRGQKYLQDWWSNLVTKSLDQPKWLRDMLPKAFDPDQPRDETGKWTSGGGDGGGGAAPAATPAAPPAASAAKPQITPLVGVSKDGARRVERALSAIPAAHAEALKDVKIYIQPTSTIIGYDPGGGDVTGKYSPINQTIQVAETVPVKFPKKTVDIPYSNLERVTLHELGHAFDDRYVSTKSAEIAGDVSTGIGRMTRQEKADGAYFILGDRGGINAGESFAELYSLAYNPVQSGERAGPLQVYFGGLSRRRAETVFKEALAKVRAM